VALLAVLALLGLQVLRHPEYRRVALAALAGAVLTGVWIAVAPAAGGAGDGDGPLVMDYARAPYLHRMAGGVQFGSAVLVESSVSADAVAPGGEITVMTAWRDVPAGASLRLELVPFTGHLFADTPVWAGAELPIATGSVHVPVRLPAYIPPGLYAIRPSLRVHGAVQGITTSQGVGLSLLSLEPVRVEDVAPSADPSGVLASFGLPNRPVVITLREAYAEHLAGGAIRVDLLWRSEAQAARNYQLSVRAYAPDGTQLASRDMPPLAGNYPTNLWQPGHVYPDSLRISLPEGVARERVTDVEIVLYDGKTLAAIGSVVIPLDQGP
jgi:hypothetical protein